MKQDQSSILWREFEQIPKGYRDNLILQALQLVMHDPERILSFGVTTDSSCEVDVIEFPNGIIIRSYPQSFESGILTREQYEQTSTGRYLLNGSYELRQKETSGIGVAVFDAVRLIDDTLTVVGFVSESRIEWYPTFRAMKDEQTPPAPTFRIGTILGEDQGKLAKQILTILDSLGTQDKTDLMTAVRWCWQGCNSSSLFVAFESHWKAIESLSNTWVRKLGIQKDDKAILNDILEQVAKTRYKKYFDSQYTNLTGLPSESLVKFIRWAGDFAEPWVRQNIQVAFQHCFLDKADKLLNTLFAGKPSIKELRDQIVHADISEAASESQELVKPRLADLRRVAREFVFESLRKRLQ